MAKIRYIGDLRKTIAKALASGGQQHSLFSYSWNIAGRCNAPVTVELYAREYADRRPLNPRKAAMLTLETKCRKCRNCIRDRQGMWSWRAVEEWSASSRSWLGTLTYAPENLFLLVSKTRLRLARGGTDFDRLPANEQFAELHKSIGVELTKWLKRVRETTQAPIRFLLVTELHKSGAPHHHVLIHEVSPEKPVRKAVLDASWTFGFSQWRLVKDKRGATYVTKYLMKGDPERPAGTEPHSVRVRASVRYGRPLAARSVPTASAHRKAARLSVPAEGPNRPLNED